MANRYKKRVSTVQRVPVGDREVDWYTFGHHLFQAGKPLPCHEGQGSRAMQQGYKKAFVEWYQARMAEVREAYRKGLYEPLPRFQKDVDGIIPGTTRYETEAEYPLKRGSNGSRTFGRMAA